MPGYGPVPVRFMRPAGWRGVAGIFWGESGECGEHGTHVARGELRRGAGEAPDTAHDGWEEWHPEVGTSCSKCNASYDPDAKHSHFGSTDHIWPTDSGALEPGCSRARNCTRPTEPHRCWVRHHDPETETAIFTVGKEGDTCSAGAGSIDDGEYHGFLLDGAFTAG